MFTLSAIAHVGVNLPNADFWLLRVHSASKVGEPSFFFAPERIGIKIERPDLLDPRFAYYLFDYLWRQGYWRHRCHGIGDRMHIRVSDVKEVPLQSYGGGKDTVGAVKEFAPFDPYLPGQQPSPWQLKILCAISPAFAEEYGPLAEMEQLANPLFSIPEIGIDHKIEYGLHLLAPKQRLLFAISWAQRTLPAVRRFYPKYLATARIAIAAARRVTLGLASDDVRVAAQWKLHEAMNKIDEEHIPLDDDPGYRALQCIDYALDPLTVVDQSSLIGALDDAVTVLSCQRDYEKGIQPPSDSWICIREDQLAELISIIRGSSGLVAK